MEKFENRFEQIRSINNIVITSNEFMTAFTGIQDCVKRSISFSEPVGSMLLAEGGLGKTTLCKTILSLMPRTEKIEKDYKKNIIPVCYVEVPSPATVKSLAITMLKELGDPTYENGYGTTEYLTSRLIYLLAQCETKLIFLDEFHHFIDRESKKVLVTLCDWLKSLIVNTKIPVVLFGMPISENILKVDNWQLSRRFNYRHNLVPFPQDEAGLNLFRGFLREIEGQLPLLGKSNLAGKSLSERIYYATDGTIGHVMTLIRKGATYAIEHDSSCIDMEASYAQDRESTENQSYSNKKKKKKKSVSDINKMLTT